MCCYPMPPDRNIGDRARAEVEVESMRMLSRRSGFNVTA